MTKFGRILQLTDDVKSAAFLQVNAPLTEKTMGIEGLSCFGRENKNGGHFTRFKSKN